MHFVSIQSIGAAITLFGSSPIIKIWPRGLPIVTWWSGPGGIQALSKRPTGFPECFDTVGLVIRPVKIVPDMTYNVFGGTLNLAQSINQSLRYAVSWQ